MKTAFIIACLCMWTVPYISRASEANARVYCQSETFRPRCSSGETVIMSKAVYGRMSDVGRCLRDEEELPALKGDPKYMHCFEDVLHLVSERCSGTTDCEIRIPDPEMENTNPCYRHMAKYLEVTYHCVQVVQPDRSCEVDVNSEQKFLLPTENDGSGDDGLICGSRDRPWLLEAPSGQRVNISLLDFTSSSRSSSSHRPRTVDTESLASGSGCERQFGFIEDKSANRNINICSDPDHRLRTLYVSKTNQVAIILRTARSTSEDFLISIKAVGCSDLVPPIDAWLKRSDNVATVGCFMTRQTWILTCDHTGTWTGTFGNCTQQLLAMQDSSDVKMKPVLSHLQTTTDMKVIILVAIIGVSSLVCIIIICIGLTWLCRLRDRKSRGLEYSDGDLLTSLDVKSITNHNVE